MSSSSLQRYTLICLVGSLVFSPGLLLSQSSSGSSKGKLDKDFYNDYLDNLPNPRERKEKVLRNNLLRVARRAILLEDPNDGKSYVKNKLKEKDIVYEVVTEESPFIRGLFHEVPYLKPTSYMWIMKTGPYLIFVSFKADPMVYICAEYQTRTLIKRTPVDVHKADD